MRGASVVLQWACLLGAFLCAEQVQAQAAQQGATLETINVTDARPVAKAMDVIEERYGVLIDYVDPQYLAAQDVRLEAKTISIQYSEVAGTPESVAPIYRCNLATLGCAPVTVKPEDGIQALIQQVLDEFAADGGQAFTVQKLEMPYGTRWEVYPTEARNSSGAFVSQPDLLGAKIFIAKARRWPQEMVELIAQQLTGTWGVKFSAGWLGSASLLNMQQPGALPPEMGAENVSAWRAIADLTGSRGALGVLRLLYGTYGHGYGINIAPLPYREPPRPPTPAATPAKVASFMPAPGYWLVRSGTPEGIQTIQGALQKLGYLQTAPTTQWDSNATAALRRFQIAVGLPQTGKFDPQTALKLSPSLPQEPVLLPAHPAMDVALAYWLDHTKSGRKEIQEALTTVGFYSGPIDGEFSAMTLKALRAFQTASGLSPTGGFDFATAVKLAPFVPNAN